MSMRDRDHSAGSRYTSVYNNRRGVASRYAWAVMILECDDVCQLIVVDMTSYRVSEHGELKSRTMIGGTMTGGSGHSSAPGA
jgi:hypothetical protein